MSGKPEQATGMAEYSSRHSGRVEQAGRQGRAGRLGRAVTYAGWNGRGSKKAGTKGGAGRQG
jgi:hypothetical protein